MIAEKFYGENGNVLATVVRKGRAKEGVNFFTDPKDPIQVGVVHYPLDNSITLHVHNPIPRESTGTMEVLLVLTGKMEVQVSDGWEVQRFEMTEGDFVILQPGSFHGMTMLQDTVLFECKSGPYLGREVDKTFLKR